MARKKPTDTRKAVRRRTRALRKSLAAVDLLLSGTLHTRTKTCGQDACACMQDPVARHGPYHEWSRRRQGRLLHTTLGPEEAALVKEAIGNYRALQGLLARWEAETEDEILKRIRRKP